MNFLILSSRFLFKFYKKNLDENLFGEIFNEYHRINISHWLLIILDSRDDVFTSIYIYISSSSRSNFRFMHVRNG